MTSTIDSLIHLLTMIDAPERLTVLTGAVRAIPNASELWAIEQAVHEAALATDVADWLDADRRGEWPACPNCGADVRELVRWERSLRSGSRWTLNPKEITIQEPRDDGDGAIAWLTPCCRGEVAIDEEVWTILLRR